MEAYELRIRGAWVFSPEVHGGALGSFVEPYDAPGFARTVGHRLTLGHVNVAAARAGVLRGVHYGDVPPGQAKLVTCVSGEAWDVVVDLRVGSPTFGEWAAVVLDDTRRRAVYLSEGLGHGYLSLSDDTVLVYLCSQPFMEGREHRLNALDPALGIAWPGLDRTGLPIVRVRGRHDSAAPDLAELHQAGRLPIVQAVRAWSQTRQESAP